MHPDKEPNFFLTAENVAQDENQNNISNEEQNVEDEEANPIISEVN